DVVSVPVRLKPATTDATEAAAPPRLAEWLLRRTLPHGVRGETILGDLVEEWRERGGTRAATVWYWRHALSLTAGYGRRGERPAGQAQAGDRKSTRLNSSHEWISYAVFCLKKKTHTIS